MPGCDTMGKSLRVDINRYPYYWRDQVYAFGLDYLNLKFRGHNNLSTSGLVLDFFRKGVASNKVA